MRADVYLFSHGFARSREGAKKSIESGLVSIDGIRILKPSEKIDETLEHDVIYEPSQPFVGRGGVKLQSALDLFEVDVLDYVAVDIGASTGGFTDCLLKYGAKKVFAVDSGHDQLAPELRSDLRVVSLEGINARHLDFDLLGELCDIAVMDVSFISQTLIIPQIPSLLKDSGVLISLIKPQFECGKEAVGKGGIVRKAHHRLSAVRRVVLSAQANGLYLSALITSPIVGGDGNVEYLAMFTKNIRNDSERIISNVDYNN